MLTNKELSDLRDSIGDESCFCATAIGKCQNCKIMHALGELQMRREFDDDDFTMSDMIEIVAKEEGDTLSGRTLRRAAKFIEILESEIAELESDQKAKK